MFLRNDHLVAGSALVCKRSFDAAAGDEPQTLALECNQNDLERLDDCLREGRDLRPALHYSECSKTMA